MSATIRVTIDKEGNPTVSVNGVAGASCQQLTKDLEKALGNATDVKKTGDFYEIEGVGESSGRKETA